MKREGRGLRPDQPDDERAGEGGNEGKRNADADEIPGGDFISFLLQDADPGNVGRGTDRGDVAAERGPDKQAERKQIPSIALHSFASVDGCIIA